MKRVLTTTHLRCTDPQGLRDEKGVITVEACTSFMIFIFAFYVLLEMLKIFAVKVCMQDLTTAIALEASMTTYYEDKVGGQYQSMNYLSDYDYEDGRLELADSLVNYNGGSDTSVLSLANYYMEDTNNMYRLIADDNVSWFSIDLRTQGWGTNKKIIVTCYYRYEILNIPFWNGGALSMDFMQVSSTYAWTE